jgi:outer membrane receptor for ferrienterochelin and colicins
MRFHGAFTVAVILFASFYSFSQSIEGRIHHQSSPVAGAHIQVSNATKYAVSDANGFFMLAFPFSTDSLEIVVSAVGYRTVRQIVYPTKGQVSLPLSVALESDLLQLEEVVVTGTRSAVPQYTAPVIVHRIDAGMLKRIQANTLAEGLSFSPGLRVENNCQNCGFTQVRMNGLPGPYAQMLINSRPIYSALMGVYGLELVPSAMIDRIEVSRGAGSVLYGGNAIAGTVNVITREPTENEATISGNVGLIGGTTPEHTVQFSASRVDETHRKGIRVFGMNRGRDAWDANGDSFSELTQLRTSGMGLDGFLEINDYQKLKLQSFVLREFRRGGNAFDRPPHQADVAEQLDHTVAGGGITWDWLSRNYKRKYSMYVSAQHTLRNSYYGGGGRVLTSSDTMLLPDDLLAIHAYGRSTDLSYITGAQYVHELHRSMTFTAGAEWVQNSVQDQMPGYNRSILQTVSTIGSFAQMEWRPSNRLVVLMGGRLDQVSLQGSYRLTDELQKQNRVLPVAVPRISARYKLSPDWQLRLGAAQGYRAPQAFDEDLHINTVGGAALFTRLDPDLKPERSESLNASFNYTKRLPTQELNAVIETFYTRISNPFLLGNQEELPNGIAVITKRNGEASLVQGINLELSMAKAGQWLWQSGFTFQQARYTENEVVWSPSAEASTDSVVATNKLLRTPDWYGFVMVQFMPASQWSLQLNTVLTGPMTVPHVIDPETEFTVLKRTPFFLDQMLKVSWKPIKIAKSPELHVGIQNIWNSFQRDFDRGPQRDALYTYGPLRPRSFFLGFTWSL